MSRPPKRATETTVWRCRWCKQSLSLDVPTRTPSDSAGPMRHVGVYVCSEFCPDRPDGATVFYRQRSALAHT